MGIQTQVFRVWYRCGVLTVGDKTYFQMSGTLEVVLGIKFQITVWSQNLQNSTNLVWNLFELFQQNLSPRRAVIT